MFDAAHGTASTSAASRPARASASFAAATPISARIIMPLVRSASRVRMLGVQNTRLVDDVARPDAARFFDEFDARFSEFVCLARCDRRGIFPVCSAAYRLKLATSSSLVMRSAGVKRPVAEMTGCGACDMALSCVSYGLMTR